MRCIRAYIIRATTRTPVSQPPSHAEAQNPRGRGGLSVGRRQLVWSSRLHRYRRRAAANGAETVRSRRACARNAQSVPCSLASSSGDTLDRRSTNSIEQVSQLVPSLNYVSPNPRHGVHDSQARQQRGGRLAGQRRARARRRLLRRRRLSRAAGRGVRLRGPRPRRGAARPAGHVVRQGTRPLARSTS